jgi:hypothetical protein
LLGHRSSLILHLIHKRSSFCRFDWSHLVFTDIFLSNLLFRFYTPCGLG